MAGRQSFTNVLDGERSSSFLTATLPRRKREILTAGPLPAGETRIHSPSKLCKGKEDFILEELKFPALDRPRSAVKEEKEPLQIIPK